MATIWLLLHVGEGPDDFAVSGLLCRAMLTRELPESLQLPESLLIGHVVWLKCFEMLRPLVRIIAFLSFLPSATGLTLAVHQHSEHPSRCGPNHYSGDHSDNPNASAHGEHPGHSREGDGPSAPQPQSSCPICFALTAGFVATVVAPDSSMAFMPQCAHAAWPSSQLCFVQDVPNQTLGRAPPIA